jgi:hypothetical protein
MHLGGPACCQCQLMTGHLKEVTWLEQCGTVGFTLGHRAMLKCESGMCSIGGYYLSLSHEQRRPSGWVNFVQPPSTPTHINLPRPAAPTRPNFDGSFFLPSMVSVYHPSAAQPTKFKPCLPQCPRSLLLNPTTHLPQNPRPPQLAKKRKRKALTYSAPILSYQLLPPPPVPKHG